MCFLNAGSQNQTAAPLMSTSSTSTLLAFSCLTLHQLACSLNAICNHRKEKKEVFRRHVTVLKAATAAGKDWRAELRDCLKKWEPDFQEMNRKKRRVGIEETLAVSQETQVNPDLI